MCSRRDETFKSTYLYHLLRLEDLPRNKDHLDIKKYNLFYLFFFFLVGIGICCCSCYYVVRIFSSRINVFHIHDFFFFTFYFHYYPLLLFHFHYYYELNVNILHKFITSFRILFFCNKMVQKGFFLLLETFHKTLLPYILSFKNFTKFL